MAKRRRIHVEPVPCHVQYALPCLLHARELGFACGKLAAAAPAGPVKRSLEEGCLQLLGLQGGFDTHDDRVASMFVPHSLQQRSAVQEIALLNGLLFILLQSGVCHVFSVKGPQHTRLGVLNSNCHEAIRTLVANSNDVSMMTVSCLSTDSSVLLHCKSTPAVATSFQPGAFCTSGRQIMEVVGGWGFVEFDDVCTRALLLNTRSMQFKVYDTADDYRLLFTLPASDVIDLKLSQHHLVVLERARPWRMPDSTASCSERKAGMKVLLGGCSNVQAASAMGLLVYAAANGQRLAHHQLLLPFKASSSSTPFDVFELCGSRLLVKLPTYPLEVYEVLGMQLHSRRSHEKLSEVSCFILSENRPVFLTASGTTLTTWNFSLEALCHFEDHELWYPGTQHSNTIHVDDQHVMSLCRAHLLRTHLPADSEPGAIHISSIMTGKLLTCLSVSEPPLGGATGDDHAAAAQACTPVKYHDTVMPGACYHGEHPIRRALTDVTSLMYVVGEHHIYTGDQSGHIHLWAPGHLVR